MATFEITGPDGAKYHVVGPEGSTEQQALEKIQAQTAEKPSVAADVAKSGGIGVVKGGLGLAGLPGDLGALIGKGAEKLGIPEDVRSAVSTGAKAVPIIGSLTGPTSRDLRGGLEKVTGPLYEPKTTAGEYAQTGGEFLPGVIGGGASIPVKLATRVAAPALASETAGQATKGTAAEPYARIAAALVAGPAAARAITPMPMAPGRQAMVDTLLAEGVTPTAGQRTGSKALQYAESSLGDFPGAGGRATAATEAAGQQFTGAALRRIGMHEPPTRPNLDARVQEISDTFRDLSARNTLSYDRQFVTDIQDTVRRYDRKLPSQQREVFHNYIQDLQQFPGRVPGEIYQVTRSDLSRQAHALRHSDPTLSDALRGVRNALDNAMGRSISPADREAWQEARRHWGNWRTLEGPSKNTDATGNISITPLGLQQAAATRDRGAFARGQGDFAELAQAGAPIMKPLPQSGTTPRAIASGLLSSIGAAAGAGGGGLPGAIGGAAAGMAVPAAVGRALMSRPAQAYLRNQLIDDPQTARDALVRALLADQSSQSPLRITVGPNPANFSQ